MKGMRLAAVLLAALSLWAGTALGEVKYTTLFYDTLYAGVADSSAVVNISSYDYVALQLIPTQPKAGDGADSTLVLYVSAFEVLPKYYTASADTAAGEDGAPADTSDYEWTPSAVTDTTVVPWMPNLAIRQAEAGVAVADTIAYNSLDGSATLPTSFEVRVRFPARPIAGDVFRPRAVTVPLVSTTGVPFQARFAYFKWRSATMTDDHLVSNLRVILKGVRY